MSTSQLELSLFELREKVQAGSVGWKEAESYREALMGDRPWASKEWKQMRDAKIETSCRDCGTKTPPLVLQHTCKRLPSDRLYTGARQLYQDQWNRWKEAHPVSVDASVLTLDGKGCPKCGSSTITQRKRTNDWKCRSKTGGVFCHHIFSSPVAIVSPDTIYSLEKSAKQQRRDNFDRVYKIREQAILDAIDQDIKYLSMEDTITLCKRCAFVADRTEMVLCEICKERYHARSYDRCSSCAGVKAKPNAEPDEISELDPEPEENPYNYGSLLIMNVTKDGFGIAVPLNVLNEQQRKTLEAYLGKGDYKKSGRRKGPYLIWEAWNWTDGGVLIDCIKLTDTQYQESLRLYEDRGRSNSGV